MHNLSRNGVIIFNSIIGVCTRSRAICFAI